MSTELEGATVSWRGDTLVATVSGGRLPSASVRALSLASTTKEFGGRRLAAVEVHFDDVAAATTQLPALAASAVAVLAGGKRLQSDAKFSVGTDFGINPDGSGIEVDD